MFINSKKRALLNKCKQIISLNESESHPSCQKDILELLTNALTHCNVSAIPNSEKEIEMRAYVLLANYSFDLLSSGRYHIYRGTLNPNSPAKNLKAVYKAAMRYALEKGEIDEETLIDQEDFLNEKIAQVG